MSPQLDPNGTCKDPPESALWCLVHDGAAHPLLVLTGYCRWAVRFHDWTSWKAWPSNRYRSRARRREDERA